MIIRDGTDNDKEICRNSRTLHPTAKLGFHAPALILPDGSYSKQDVNKAYSIALEAVALLSGLRDNGIEIPEYLFKAIITTPFESMNYVDTVGKALKYKIDVSDIKISPNDIQSALNNICDNSIKDKAIIVDESISRGSNYVMIDDDLIIPKGYWSDYVASCRISVQPQKKSFSVSFFYNNIKSFGEKRLPYIASFPSEKLLASAFYEMSIASDKFLVKARESMKNSYEQTCRIWKRTTKIVNVENFTNLRQKAGLSGQVIGQVPFGASVLVSEPGFYLSTKRCGHPVCNGTNQNAIKQCIDNNEVWIKVEYNGRRGFLSRRFLQ